MNIQECVLVRAVESYECIGFMEWHARVLRELSHTPQTIKELARKTGLFHYHVRGVVMDLLALQLIQYTRKGIQIADEWDMLHQLISCCEAEGVKKSFDYEAAFEVVTPKVLALEKQYPVR